MRWIPHFVGIHRLVPPGKTQELHSGAVEFAFFSFQEKMVLQETLDKLMYMLDVFFKSFSEDQDVLKVHGYKLGSRVM